MTDSKNNLGSILYLKHLKNENKNKERIMQTEFKGDSEVVKARNKMLKRDRKYGNFYEKKINKYIHLALDTGKFNNILGVVGLPENHPFDFYIETLNQEGYYLETKRRVGIKLNYYETEIYPKSKYDFYIKEKEKYKDILKGLFVIFLHSDGERFHSVEDNKEKYNFLNEFSYKVKNVWHRERQMFTNKHIYVDNKDCIEFRGNKYKDITDYILNIINNK